MRVYVETNFILEMAFEQEQVAACEGILQLVETNSSAKLAIPAFSFVEPPEKLRRQAHERLQLQNSLNGLGREFKRSKRFTQDQEDAWSAVAAMLVRDTQEAERKFETLRERLLQCAQVLPLTADVIEEGSKYLKSYGLKFPDALVLASVLSDPVMGSTPSCFLNRNTRDFDDPAIKAALKQRGCKLIGSFDTGFEYLQHVLKPDSQ